MRSVNWEKGLIPAIVQDADSSEVLMLGYMNQESWEKTLAEKKVTFFSRRRQSLWTKGETSGNYLDYVVSEIDCDGDALLIKARPRGPVCHTGEKTCFHRLGFLQDLSEVIRWRLASLPDGSYITRLHSEGLDRVIQKVGEEAIETVIAAKGNNLESLESEAADLLFHLMVLLEEKGSSLGAVTKVLEGRHRVEKRAATS